MCIYVCTGLWIAFLLCLAKTASIKNGKACTCLTMGWGWGGEQGGFSPSPLPVFETIFFGGGGGGGAGKHVRSLSIFLVFAC